MALKELASASVLFPWEAQLIQLLVSLRPEPSSDHDIYHSLRVKALALQLVQAYGGDGEALAAAAYLHDLGSDNDRLQHVEIGMQQTNELLPRVGFPPGKVPLVLSCVHRHEEYRWDALTTESQAWPQEVLLFQDADRLDAVGAVGIARTFAFGGAHGIPIWIPGAGGTEPYSPERLSLSSLDHLARKIVRLEETLNTDLARQIAGKRIAFVKDFVARFLDEWMGGNA